MEVSGSGTIGVGIAQPSLSHSAMGMPVIVVHPGSRRVDGAQREPQEEEMTKLILTLILLAGSAALVPQPVAAAECTRQYSKCLNDSYDTSGWLRVLADLECGAQYAGCIAALMVTR
jgi:hypothetical protein